MAEKRMFAKSIIDSDAFLDMPLSTQALYFHLSMRADDEGFINNPKKIQRMIGASEDDLKLLIAKSFIIPFESGIVVIKHWRIHNYIRQDRLHPTKYTEERGLLEIKENGAYTIPTDTCQSNDSQMSGVCHTEIRLDKIRLEENRIEESKPTAKRYAEDNALNDAIKDFVDHRKKLRKPMTDRAIELLISRLNNITSDVSEQISLINTAIERGWQTVYPSKETHAEPKKSNSKLQELEALYLEE